MIHKDMKVYIHMYRLNEEGVRDVNGKRLIVLMGTDEMIAAAKEMGMEPAFIIEADGRKEMGTPHGWSLYMDYQKDVDEWVNQEKRN